MFKKIDLKFSKAVREQEINMENYDEKQKRNIKNIVYLLLVDSV